MSSTTKNNIKGSLFLFALLFLNLSYGQNTWLQSQVQVAMNEPCQIECVSYSVYCNQDLSEAVVPTVMSCAQIYSIEIVDEVFIDEAFCDDNQKQLERTWQALDVSNNELSTCVQTITVLRSDLTFPKDITWTYEQYEFYSLLAEPVSVHESIFDLDEYDQEDDIDVDPGLSDYVLQNTGSGWPVGGEDASCLYDITYSDDIVFGCKQSFEIYRTWQVFEQCSGLLLVDVQKISINDKSSNVDLGNSEGYVMNNMNYEYHVAVDASCLSTDFILLPQLGEGADTNSITLITPVGALVNLSDTGGYIPAPGLTIGTYPEGLEIHVSDFCGNTEILLVTLIVEGSNKPSCVAPLNVSVTCKNFTTDLTAYGELDLNSGCGSAIDSSISSVNWNEYDSICHTGVVTRYWSVWDQNGNTESCLQKITISQPLSITVQFPDDVNDGSIDTIPLSFGGSCGQMSWEVFDEKVIPAGTCLGKIYRTYTTRNLCDYESNYQPEIINNPLGSTSGAVGVGTLQNHSVLSYTMIIDNYCDTRKVNGKVHLENGAGIENVKVTAVSNDLTQPNYSAITDDLGNYSLTLPVASNYIITPSKLDDTYKNGVDMADVNVLYKHILIIPEITSAYKIIAANVLDNDQAHIEELLEIKKLVLNKIDGFENKPMWTFAKSDIVFPEPKSPYGVHQLDHQISQLQDDKHIDFVGIKYGDLDNSISAIQNKGAANRSNESALLTINNIYVEAEKEYEIPFNLLSENDILSYQFTLEFDYNSLSFVEMVSYYDTEDFNFSEVSNGLIATAFAGELSGDEPIFVARFIAKESGFLSDMLELSDEIAETKVFDKGLERIELELEYSEDTKLGLVLAQNEPNPFRDATAISFELQQDELVNFTIYAIDGYVVFQEKKWYPSGWNKKNFAGDLFKNKGVYIYRLETQDNVYLKKMIKH